LCFALKKQNGKILVTGATGQLGSSWTCYQSIHNMNVFFSDRTRVSLRMNLAVAN
jgi:short-subunit dehydrogenase